MCWSSWLVVNPIVLLSKAMVCCSKSDPWAQRWGRKKLINPGSPYPAPPLPDIADMPFKSSSRKAGAFASLLCLALPVTFSVWSQVAGDRPGNTAVTFTPDRWRHSSHGQEKWSPPAEPSSSSHPPCHRGFGTMPVGVWWYKTQRFWLCDMVNGLESLLNFLRSCCDSI